MYLGLQKQPMTLVWIFIVWRFIYECNEEEIFKGPSIKMDSQLVFLAAKVLKGT